MTPTKIRLRNMINRRLAQYAIIGACILLHTAAMAQSVTDNRLSVNYFQSRESDTRFTEELTKRNIPLEAQFRFLFGYYTQPYGYEEDECWLYYDTDTRQLVARPANQTQRANRPAQWTLRIEGAIIDSLTMLTQVAIESATHQENIGVNGTYYLFNAADGSAATTWSPKKGSNCRRLVGLYREVCRAVKNSDPAALESLQPKVDELIKLFRRYYAREWR